MLQDFLQNKKELLDKQYPESIKGKKKHKYITALYVGLTNMSMPEIAQVAESSHGVVRVWKTEQETKTKVKEYQDEFVELVTVKFKDKDHKGFDFEGLNDEVKSRLIERFTGMISGVADLKEKLLYISILKRYFGYCDCEMLLGILVSIIK